MKILVFDTETTGIPSSKFSLARQPHIIQFAAILYELNASLEMIKLQEINELIDPGVEVPLESILIHKISNEMLVGKPRFADLAVRIKDVFLASDMAVAHNIAFDKKLLEIEFERLDQSVGFWPKQIYDTMLESVNLCRLPSRNRGFKSPRLSELHSFLFGSEFANAHNALDDVLATGRCLQELIKRGHANLRPSVQGSLF